MHVVLAANRGPVAKLGGGLANGIDDLLPPRPFAGCGFRARQWPSIYAFIADIAWMLAGVLGHLGAGQVTLRNGIISAAFLWFGFVLTTMW